MMDKARALYLIQQYRSQSITEAELTELRQWMVDADKDTVITGAIEEDMLQNLEAEMMDTERLDRMFRNVMRVDKVTEPAPVRRLWIRWVAAACIVLVTGYGLWVTVGHRSQETGNKTEAAVHDVPAPKDSRAVITLANGQKVYLDSAGNGTIARENNIAVVKNEKGEIVYNANSQQLTANSPSYNTLYNPRGSKVISLTLSDGTKVWLNSESSLRYPASFAPPALNREVEITGEAYFEVKHNSKQPFKVHLPNGGVIEDIGTEFNVTTYADEEAIKTTLIEGSIRVVGDAALNTNNGVVLKPNQQSVQIPQTRVIRVQNNADLEEVTAWKNGMFKFKDVTIDQLMRQISRWYDVQVSYDGAITSHFVATIPRNISAANVFKILEQTGGVHFKIDGKKIIVSK